MTHEPEPLIRVMALHSLSYCERLYYLEEVEELRVVDEAMYAGRAQHLERGGEDPSGTEVRNLTLASERLGLQGNVDALRVREGVLVPYEHKRGRPRQATDGAPEAWPSDALQVAGYAMLLEEERGVSVPEGRVHYHAENVTVRVPIGPELRDRVTAAVGRARELRASPQRPPVASNPTLCVRCSLAPVCLPEEERLMPTEGKETPRLFPANPERQVPT